MTARWTPAQGAPRPSPRTAAEAPPHRPSPVSWLTRLVGVALGWQQRAAQRRDLAGLDGRQLTDLGLSRTDALAEYRKPFWRA
jgi:uncharacterized protein YjiS (DUF1127 family)